MADLKNGKWELTSNDQCAIAWFEKNGFEVTLKKQYIGKTVYTVKKGNFEDTFYLPNGFNYDCEAYMEEYRKTYELLCKLNEKIYGNNNGGLDYTEFEFSEN